MASLLELDHATKLYGTVMGVNDVTLALPPGGYGLLGPNGAGKTTLINLVTGQLRPTIGRVHTFGVPPWDNAAVFRRIGVCPSSEALLAGVNGLEWVAYLLELRGTPPAEARSKARDSLESVGLGAAMHRGIGTYSKGMRQRAKLAQALAHDPEFLILDEPFDGLDPLGRHDMTVKLRDWVKAGRSLILASHVLHEVEAVVESFLLICGGRLLASGSSEEVRTLLVDVPSEIRVRCDRPAELGRALLERSLVEGLRLVASGTAGEGVLVLSTRNPIRVYEDLPRLVTDARVQVLEVRAPDESLQSLFESLLRIHRGGSA
jgi:ABC-2 type transport system ATP-binding protein